MKYNPDIHRRRSIRLKEFDYAQTGAYFITICTRERELLFGHADYESIVHDEWYRTAIVRPSIQLDEFICMPNHFHGIIIFIEPCRGEAVPRPDLTPNKRATRRVAPTQGIRPNTLGAIIGQFKSMTTKRINQLRGTTGLSVWQRNYYEHIIRNEDELYRIRQYIRDNPLNWETDEENPNRRTFPVSTLPF